MRVHCDWFLLIYLQIIAINAITLPLTTTSKSIPIKPQSTSVSSAGTPSPLGYCSTSSTEFTPVAHENLAKSLETFLSSSKEANPCGITITATNSNLDKISETANDNFATTNIDSCISASSIIPNIVSRCSPPKKGFTAPLSLTVTTSESPTNVLIKPSLHCGTQNVDSLVSPPNSCSGSRMPSEILDPLRLMPPQNTNSVVFTERSNPTTVKLPEEKISEISNSNSIPFSPNILFNNSPSSSKVVNSPDIAMALLNLSSTQTSHTPKCIATSSLNSESKTLDTSFSLPNIVSYFFPSLPKVTAVPGSTLSSFNANPISPEESPKRSGIKPFENNDVENNLDSFVLSPSPPKLVSSNVNPVWYPPRDCIVVQNYDNPDKVLSPNMISNNQLFSNVFNPLKKSSPSCNFSQLYPPNNLDVYVQSPNVATFPFISPEENSNYVNSKPVHTNSDIVLKNAFSNNFPSNIVTQRLAISSNVNPFSLTVDTLNCPFIQPLQERLNVSDTAASISLTKYCNNFSSSIHSGTVLPSPNLSSSTSEDKLPNKIKNILSPLNANSYIYPPWDNCNPGLTVKKPNLFIDPSFEKSNSKIIPQDKSILENTNMFNNNFQYFSNTIISPNCLPLPNLRPTATSEYYSTFYPYQLQENSYCADKTEGGAPRLYPLPKNYVYSPVVAAPPENVPPKAAPIASTESSKSSNMNNPILSVLPIISMSIPNVNSIFPLPNIFPGTVSLLETISPSRNPSHAFDLNSSLKQCPDTNKEPFSPTPIPFSGKTVAKQVANINCKPNINTISSPPNMTPDVPLKLSITSIPCAEIVRNKATVNSAPENTIYPESAPGKNKLPANVIQSTQAEEFSPTFLSRPNFICCDNFSRMSDSFSSKLNTFVFPPKVPYSSICYPLEQPSSNPEIISSVIYPVTNPCSSFCTDVHPTNSNNAGTVELIPNNVSTTPFTSSTAINNVASCTPIRHETFSALNNYLNIPKSVPIPKSSPISESGSHLSDISLPRTNNIQTLNPVVPMTSLIVPFTQKSSFVNTFPDVKSKFISVANSPTTYSSAIPTAITRPAAPITYVFDNSDSVFRKTSTQSNDKIITSINEIASSLTKDILSTILEKSLSKTKASLVYNNMLSGNPFASKLTESKPSLSGFISKPPVETTQLNDYNKYLEASFLPDIIKAIQLLINTPITTTETEITPPTPLNPYISTLTINVIPPVEESPQDTHIILPSYVPTEYNPPIIPTYFHPPIISSYPPRILPHVLVEKPGVRSNSFNKDSIGAQRLMEMILLSELMNGDNYCDWDAMENIMTLFYAS